MLNELKKILNQVLFFSVKERLGIIILLGFILIGLFTPRLIKKAFVKTENPNTLKMAFTELEKKKQEQKPLYFGSKESTYTYNKIQFKPFNPNSINENELMQFGIQSWLAQRFIKFRNAIGGFKSDHDIQKIYGLKPEVFAEMRPFLLWDNSVENSQFKNYEKDNVTQNSKKPLTQTSIIEVDFKTLVQLGFQPKTAGIFLKFREKGAHFYSADDLRKVYGITEQEIKQAEPWLVYETKPQKETAKINVDEPENNQPSFTKKDQTNTEHISESKLAKTPCTVEINTASQEEWKCIYGIGDKLSERIVTFREALGGFCSVIQISEVWGLQDSVYQKIKPQLRFTNKNLRKINVNTATETELDAHPYINKYQAQKIISWRTANGEFKNIEELRSNRLIDENTMNRVKAYISVK